MSPWPVRRGRGGASAAARPRRPGRHLEVQADRRAQHPRARLARETAARVAGGALCKAFLRALGVEVYSHVIQIASVTRRAGRRLTAADFAEVDSSPVRCLDAEASRAMVREIDACARRTSRWGASSRCRPSACVPGLGSHVSWEERLDGRLAMAICSIQAIKGVAVGDGFAVAGVPGSEAHDEIFYSTSSAATTARQPLRRPGGRG